MFDIIGKKYLYFLFSGLIIIPGTIFLILYGLRLGIDFTGGTLLEYKLEKAASPEQFNPQKESEEKSQITEALKDKIEISTLSHSGDKTYLIRTKPLEKDKIEETKKSLEPTFGQVEQTRLETVGPTIGKELVQKSLISLGMRSMQLS